VVRGRRPANVGLIVRQALHMIARWCRRHVRMIGTNLVIATVFVPPIVLPNVPKTTLAGQALVTFAATGTSAVPWNMSSFESNIGNATLKGTPSVVSGDGVTAVAAQLASGDLVYFQQAADNTTSFVDLTTSLPSPAPAASPVVFFDPWNNVDIAYVATNGTLVVITPTTMLNARGRLHAHTKSPLSVLSVPLSTTTHFGPVQPSVAVNGAQGTLIATSSTGDAIALSLTWTAASLPPTIAAPVDVTALTGTPALTGAPVAVTGAASSNLFAAITTGGAVTVFGTNGAGAWTAVNVSTATDAPATRSGLTADSNGNTTYLAAVGANGDAQLFSAPTNQEVAGVRQAHVITTPTSEWSFTNLSATITHGPTFAGGLTMVVTTTALTIAGEGSTGDLIGLSSPLPAATWTSADLSTTASNAGITVSPAITSALVNGVTTLFTYQTGYIPTTGVGVYAIPQSDWGRAISDGWPILADTGALGTQSAPWVGYLTKGGVAQSPDFLLGQTITNAHKPETWLSFWTVSGPLPGQPKTVANYYNHGYEAGVWVAQQIAQYKANGDSSVPNWVILDPEGLPDNHSNLDAPAGSSQATIASYAAYWSAIMQGWSAGIAAVDPGLHPGLYASMSEYRNYNLSSLPLPVFEAVAFGGGGPTPIAGGQGNNILGYIAFSAVCTPTSTLHSEEKTLANAPWGGEFNTLQFNGGVYCKP